MKLKLDNGEMKILELKEVEVTDITAEEANEIFDAFTEALYDAVEEDEWPTVLKYIKKFADEACENYNV